MLGPIPQFLLGYAVLPHSLASFALLVLDFICVSMASEQMGYIFFFHVDFVRSFPEQAAI